MLKKMKSVLNSLVIPVIAIGFAACAQTEKVMAKGSPPGSHFDASGRVSMHAGEPCTPQIMFDFHTLNSRSSVWLAARMDETKLLTDAARHRKKVHVSGIWKRGKDKNCNYVTVTKVTAER
jgi:hypothetical protein